MWQYITLTKRIYLIDCPGVVYPSGNSDVDTVLKGVVSVHESGGVYMSLVMCTLYIHLVILYDILLQFSACYISPK